MARVLMVVLVGLLAACLCPGSVSTSKTAIPDPVQAAAVRPRPAKPHDSNRLRQSASRQSKSHVARNRVRSLEPPVLVIFYGDRPGSWM